MIRSAFRLSILVSVLLLGGCAEIKKWYYCGYGHQSAREENHAAAVELLDACLDRTRLEPSQRAFYLQTRAWSHFNLDHFAQALDDQEASFRIVAPSTYREYINHALYLRKTGNALASLEPLREAESIDAREDRTSMMTQYHLGWSLYEIGRYEAAIAAFSKGISSQPGYPFAYFRRGLAYDRIGSAVKAETDFNEFITLLDFEPVRFEEAFIAELREAAVAYPELAVLLSDSD